MSAPEKLKWNGTSTVDGRYRLIESSVYIGPGEPREKDVAPHFSADGEPPWHSIGVIYSTRREAKAACQRHADLRQSQ